MFVLSDKARRELSLTCLFGTFVFLQLTVLGLANHAGEGYLSTEQRNLVYYALQVFVICGFLLHGDTPVFQGETPKKAADVKYTYVFKGWMPAIARVTAVVTYTAMYDETVNKYKVTFVDYDGSTVLKETAEYDYGTPAANVKRPADPTREADAQHAYKFAGWTPEVANVTGDELGGTIAALGATAVCALCLAFFALYRRRLRSR